MMESFSSTRGTRLITLYIIIIVTTVLIPCFDADTPSSSKDIILFPHDFVRLDADASSSSKDIIVFPHDFVRFECLKAATNTTNTDIVKTPQSTQCRWKFVIEGSRNTSGSTTIEESECVKVTPEGTKTSHHVYEGYVSIPEKATKVFCDEVNTAQQLDVQRVRLATPLTESYRSYDMSRPRIVLQRFSDDFGERLGAHDVTNENITIDGQKLDSLKLLCIHSSPVVWTNITNPHRRILHELISRDKSWLDSKSGKTEPWRKYLNFLLSVEEKSFEDFKGTRGSQGRDSYTTTLFIQNITNGTSRTYECRDNVARVSRVTLRIKEPRMIGPDEINLIQQILVLLDSKGERKEPYYTLSSLMSIILLLFMYYCKKKLDQPKPAEQAPAPAPAKPSFSEGTEEVELRRKLHPNQQTTEPPQPEGHDHDVPVVTVQR